MWSRAPRIPAAPRMNDRIALQDADLRWQNILKRKRCDVTSAALGLHPDSDQGQVDQDVMDPYDCSDIKPSDVSHMIRENVAKVGTQWKGLDQRRIAQQQEPHWYERHVRLPHTFDVLTKSKDPPTPMENDELVISLIDPSQTQSYEQELWKLFSTVKTEEQHEESLSTEHLKHTQTIINTMREASYNDSFGLAALRMADRHEYPTFESNLSLPTITIECWKKPLYNRGYAPHPHRAVFEFLGSQTLLDVHRTICELYDDELWNRQPGHSLLSGYFFIEGAFYTCGPIDYVNQIVHWLQEGISKQRAERHDYMGLDFDTKANHDQHLYPQHPMKEIRLNNIATRLGFRYVHVHNGNVETALYITDRQRRQLVKSASFPILHDVWTLSSARPVCEACKEVPASIMTSIECSVAVSKALCGACCRQLELPRSQIEQ